MSIFQAVAEHDHEQIIFCHDRSSGLKAIIAIHDTTLGPALGGCRMWPYESEAAALTDVLRLSRGMTYKNAAMGLDLGGGKSVVIGDPLQDKSEELFRAFGKFVASLGGRYITAVDVGVTPGDMSLVAAETRWVVGLPEYSGDPSPVTALGVFAGIKACLQAAYGNTEIKGRTVAIQGVGAVGYNLAQHLHEQGASLVVSDIFPDKTARVQQDFGAQVVAPADIYDAECDIFAPCALGAVVNDDTVPRLRCRIVAGSANNQLAENRHAAALAERNIIYAPDFVINGGGVINVTEEFHPLGYDQDRAMAKVIGIHDKLLRIMEISAAAGVSTAEAADMLAEQRINNLGNLNRLYLPPKRQ